MVVPIIIEFAMRGFIVIVEQLKDMTLMKNMELKKQNLLEAKNLDTFV